jgi:hypothetical protein
LQIFLPSRPAAFHVDGVRLCPWTATTNWPIVNHQIYKYKEPRWNDTDRGNRKIRIKPAPMPLCPPQIPHGLTARPAINHLNHSTASWTHETTYYFIKPGIRSAYWTGERRARDNPVVRFCDGNHWLTSNCIPLSPDYIYQWSINRFPRRNTKPLAFRLNFSEVRALNTKLFFEVDRSSEALVYKLVTTSSGFSDLKTSGHGFRLIVYIQRNISGKNLILVVTEL